MFAGGIPFHAFAGMGMGMGMDDEDERGPPSDDDRDTDTERLYDALGVEKGASASAIKKAFFRLARQNHPDKGGDPAKFQEIQQAYDVLGDPEKRGLYDEYGMHGVENGPPMESPRDLFEMLQQMQGGGGGRGRRARGPRKSPAVVERLPVTLRDLYVGRTCQVQVRRTLMTADEDGAYQTRDGRRFSKTIERVTLTVHVEKGMSNGQKITFEGQGDTLPGHSQGDVVIVLRCREHPHFKRKGCDLVLQREVTLSEALTGCNFAIKTLDGRTLRIRSRPGDVLEHESIKEVKEEGMPIYGHSFVRGCLFVVFNVEWPKSIPNLTPQRALMLKALLDGDEQLPTAAATAAAAAAPTAAAAPPTPGGNKGKRARRGGKKRKGKPGAAAGGAGLGGEEDDGGEGACFLEELDREARRQRESLRREGADSDDDEDGMPPGMGQAVQCQHQ